MMMKRSEHIQQKATRLLSRPDLQQDVVALRLSVGMPWAGFDDTGAAEEWKNEHIYEKVVANKAVNSGVATLLHKYQLGPDWHHSLKRYLYLNDPQDMQLPTEISVGKERDPQTGRWRVIMRIPEDASQKEIRAALPSVTQWQKTIRQQETKRQPAPFLELGKKAYDLHSRGSSYLEVARFLSESEGIDCSEQRARDLVRNYKTQARIN